MCVHHHTTAIPTPPVGTHQRQGGGALSLLVKPWPRRLGGRRKIGQMCKRTPPACITSPPPPPPAPACLLACGQAEAHNHLAALLHRLQPASQAASQQGKGREAACGLRAACTHARMHGPEEQQSIAKAKAIARLSCDLPRACASARMAIPACAARARLGRGRPAPTYGTYIRTLSRRNFLSAPPSARSTSLSHTSAQRSRPWSGSTDQGWTKSSGPDTHLHAGRQAQVRAHAYVCSKAQSANGAVCMYVLLLEAQEVELYRPATQLLLRCDLIIGIRSHLV